MAERSGPLALIGPPGAGKTCCAEHLAKETGRVALEVDARWWPHLRAQPAVAAVEPGEWVVGGDVVPARRRAWLQAVRARLVAARGEQAAARALEEAKAAAIVDMVHGTGDDAILDFGAGHSIYEHLDLRAAVKAALARARVVLLLPGADAEAAVATLGARLAAQGRPIAAARLHAYVMHPSNHALADATLYDDGRETAAVAGALMELAARLRASGRT
ncbi:AAA family ATPase [Nannocystis punicea]|uniref:AAA domain-containing protein n=1 Tax=Nannocystis punicea TaxID=2995304 RepID=A0ABY7GU00_9BACT|nr:AAA family ATPase [Nannocystis poenicansa]WAS90437.1 hypothetical protein O0S08_29970 [Nannocystis poenicansa]